MHDVERCGPAAAAAAATRYVCDHVTDDTSRVASASAGARLEPTWRRRTRIALRADCGVSRPVTVDSLPSCNNYASRRLYGVDSLLCFQRRLHYYHFSHRNRRRRPRISSYMQTSMFSDGCEQSIPIHGLPICMHKSALIELAEMNLTDAMYETMCNELAISSTLQLYAILYLNAL